MEIEIKTLGDSDKKIRVDLGLAVDLFMARVMNIARICPFCIYGLPVTERCLKGPEFQLDATERTKKADKEKDPSILLTKICPGFSLRGELQFIEQPPTR